MNKKKLLALLMALVMTLSLLPVTAFAEGNVAKIGIVEYATLQEAFNDVKDSETITLLDNVTITGEDYIYLTDKTYSLDLAGHTIDDPNDKLLFWGTDITITNSTGNGTFTAPWGLKVYEGRVTVEGGTIYGAYVNNGQFTVKGGTITAADSQDYAIYVGRFESYEHPSVSLQGGTVTIPHGKYGVFVDNGASLTVSDGANISGEGVAIATNGSSSSNANITINGGTIDSSGNRDNSEQWNAIYLPAGNLTVNGGNITGATGIFMRGGTLTIPSESTAIINGTCAKAAPAFASTDDGAVPTGDAVAIVASGSSYSAVSASIAGGIFNSTNAYAVGSYAVEAQTAPTGFISGGKFNSDPSAYLADGYMVKSVTGGYQVVPDSEAVAQIGNKKYETLESAVAAAQDNDTITLIANNIAVTSTIEITKSITINGNGKTINATGNGSGYVFYVHDTGETSVTCDISNVTIEAAGFQVALLLDSEKGSTLTLNNVTVSSDGECVYGNGMSTVNAENCHFTHSGRYVSNKDIVYYSAVMVGYSGVVNLTNCTVESTEYGVSTFPTGSTINLYDTNVSVIDGPRGANADPAALWVRVDKGYKNSLAVSSYINVYAGSKITGALKTTNSTFLSDIGGQKNAFITCYENSSYSVDPRTCASTDHCGVIVPDDCTVREDNSSASTLYIVEKLKVARNTTQDITYTDLQQAFDSANSGDTIELLQNIALTAPVNITKNLTINLANHNITATDARALHVKSGNVIITGEGTISSNHTTGNTAFTAGSSVIRVGDGLRKDDPKLDEASLTIDDQVTVVSNKCYGVSVFGVNKDSLGLTVDGTINVTGEGSAVANNGNSWNTATTMTINGTVTSNNDSAKTYAIYHPGKGTLTVNGSVEGYGGIEAKSGTVYINSGATVRATAEEQGHDPNYNGSSTEGYAIAAISNTSYVGDPTVIINSNGVSGKVIMLVDDNADLNAVVKGNASNVEAATDFEWKNDDTDDGYDYVLTEVINKETAPTWQWHVINGQWAAIATYKTAAGSYVTQICEARVSSSAYGEIVYTANDGKHIAPDKVVEESYNVTYNQSQSELANPYSWGEICTLNAGVLSNWFILDGSKWVKIAAATETYTFAVTGSVEIKSEPAIGEEAISQAIVYATLKSETAAKAEFQAKWSIPKGATVQSVTIYRGYTSTNKTIDAKTLIAKGTRYDANLNVLNGDFLLKLTNLTSNTYQHAVIVIKYKVGTDVETLQSEVLMQRVA